MIHVNLNLDSGGMKPIVAAFENQDYNQDFCITLEHRANSRVEVEKYPLICSIVNEIRQLGNNCQVILNCENRCAQLNYAERMGFLSFLGIQYDYPLTRRNGRGRFIELKNVNRIYYPEKEILDVFENDFNLSNDQANDVAIIISELVNNSSMHSETEGGAVFYCQKYPQDNFLNLFIVDSGVGIFRGMHVLEKYRTLNELETLKKSLEFGEGNGRGYGQGLFLVSQFIKRNLGYLRLITGNYIYQVINQEDNFIRIPHNYKGVVLNLRIPFAIDASINDIMIENMT